MRHRITILIVLIGLVSAGLPPSRVLAQEIPTVYFAQTGHHVDDRYGFLTYRRANGQITRFGYPISEEVIEHGRPVQYFERARMEFHSDQGRVLLGLLGHEVGSRTPAAAKTEEGRYFAETGHTLSGEFYGFWSRYDGLQFLGYPLSEAYEEAGMLVQWFERGRLEYHSKALRQLWQQYEQLKNIDLDPLYEIIPTAVGRLVAQSHAIPTEAIQRRPGISDWSPQLWAQTIRVSLSTFTLEAYEGDLRVLSAPVAIGKPGFETVTGSYQIGQKWWEKDMRSTERGESWDTYAVPFTQFFYRDWAIHGTYWHTDFGTRRSHGCVNLPLAEAEWLYNWTVGGSAQGARVIVTP